MASSLTVVSKRYSKALWRLAEGPAEASGWTPALKNFSQTLATSKDLQGLFKSPAYSAESKLKVLEEILSRLQAPLGVVNFVKYLLKSGRLAALPEITKQFEVLVDESNNTIEARVETAIPLTEVQKQSLVVHLEKFTGKKIRVLVEQNAELLAGIKVHMSGRTLDASLTANLGMMQRALLHAEA